MTPSRRACSDWAISGPPYHVRPKCWKRLKAISPAPPSAFSFRKCFGTCWTGWFRDWCKVPLKRPTPVEWPMWKQYAGMTGGWGVSTGEPGARVCFTGETGSARAELKEFLRRTVYFSEPLVEERERSASRIGALFEYF